VYNIKTYFGHIWLVFYQLNTLVINRSTFYYNSCINNGIEKKISYKNQLIPVCRGFTFLYLLWNEVIEVVNHYLFFLVRSLSYAAYKLAVDEKNDGIKTDFWWKVSIPLGVSQNKTHTFKNMFISVFQNLTRSET
jgi:hypothetical protein